MSDDASRAQTEPPEGDAAGRSDVPEAPGDQDHDHHVWDGGDATGPPGSPEDPTGDVADKVEEATHHDTARSAPAPRMSPVLFTLVGLAAAWIAISGLREVSSFVAPIFLALTLVITVHPLREILDRRGAPGWLSSLVLILLLWLLLFALIAAVTLAVARFASVVPEYSGQFADLYQGGLDQLARLGLEESQISSAWKSIDPGSVVGVAQTLVSALSGTTSLVLLILVSLIFLVMDGRDLPRRLRYISPEKGDVVAALEDFASRVRKYWAVSTLFGLIVAVLDAIALLIMDVPLALTFGLLAFVTNYIPNVGFVLGLLPPAVLGYLHGGLGTMIAVIVSYSVLNFIVQTVIQPKFTGDAVGLNTTMTFVSLVFWAFVMGPLGALLAVPLTLFVKAMFVDRDPRTRWANAFISDTGG